MAITRRTNILKQQQSNTLNLPPQNIEKQQPPKEASKYELSREQRIKENHERLKKLGILHLSFQLNAISSTSSRRTPKSHFKSPSLVPIQPPRPSSRYFILSSNPSRAILALLDFEPVALVKRDDFTILQNTPLVTYVEAKGKKSRRNKDIVLEEGAKPEFYTEEHEKLLGNTEMPWTLFVDGCAKDGGRIYDPVQGKTCHQYCWIKSISDYNAVFQKTLRQRTRCSKCNLVQGQFCGDCLYMRYGEHVVEANRNPNWVCPPCRGICNCSLCRHAKGWAPTGALYKRISNLGYKSVAHFLAETRRAPPKADTATDTQQSAKRSLPLEGLEVPTNDKGADYKTITCLQSENDTTPDVEPNLSSMIEPIQDKNGPKNVGRPRKRSMKEYLDANCPAFETDSIARRLRSRNKA